MSSPDGICHLGDGMLWMENFHQGSPDKAQPFHEVDGGTAHQNPSLDTLLYALTTRIQNARTEYVFFYLDFYRYLPANTGYIH